MMDDHTLEAPGPPTVQIGHSCALPLSSSAAHQHRSSLNYLPLNGLQTGAGRIFRAF